MQLFMDRGITQENPLKTVSVQSSGEDLAVPDDRLNLSLIDDALRDLDDDVARTGVACSEDDLNRAAERHRLSILEVAGLRERALADELLVTDLQEGQSREGEMAGPLAERGQATPMSSLLMRLDQYPLLDAAGEIALARKIKMGARADAVLMDKPGPTERKSLEEASKEGLRAKQRLVGCNIRLAIANAKSFKGQGLDFDDLVQAAMPGLIRAAEKFDHRMGNKFSTYATWWIRQSIARAIADTGRTIRLPVHVIERLNKFRRVSRRLEGRLGREPTHQELASQLEWDAAEVAAITEALPSVVSLDAPLSSDGRVLSLADVIPSESPSPFEEAEELIRTGLLRDALDDLKPREKEVIELRHGLNGPPRTLDEVGRKFGVTRERIRQIEKHSIEKLRRDPRLSAL